MRSVIDIMNLSKSEIGELIELAISIANEPHKYKEKCKGKILANLFFEPSTRTRMSIESAMYSLGGNVITMSDQATSSTSKGETLSDTIRVISSYADIIAIRHPHEGAALVASNNSVVPVINAGDGGHCHPTQTLADLLTIYREKNSLNSLKIGFVGDLKYGRTVHSLINALTRYSDTTVYLISPEELRLPDYTKSIMTSSGIDFMETSSLEEFMPELDVLYMTRIQKERFQNSDTYEMLKDVYVLNKETLKNAKNDMIIMHPLPRVNEISTEIDSDSRACYFKQVANGKLMRMALILKLLFEDHVQNNFNDKMGISCECLTDNSLKCKNPRCITNYERGLDHIYEIKDDVKYCIYCETRV